jgi:hypothetical protein
MWCVKIDVDGAPYANCECPDPEAGYSDADIIPCGAIDCIAPCTCDNFYYSQCTCLK